MTGLLKQAFDRVSNLPETLQDEIAGELLADLGEEAHLRKIAEHVKKLVEYGQIADAREVLSTVQPGTSAALDNWQRALSKPTAKLEKSAGGESARKDALWLQDNLERYKGNWIAVKNGILLGAHESRIELRRVLKQSGKLAGSMFFRVDS